MRLPSKDFQSFIKSNMGFRRYTFNELHSIYTDILNRDAFIKYELMSRQSFKAKLKTISEVEGSWLLIEGKSQHRTYRAIDPEYCCNFSSLHDRAMKIYQKGKEKYSWFR